MGLVEGFQTKRFGKKLNIISLNIRKFIKWASQGETTTSQTVLAFLKGNTEGRKEAHFAAILGTGSAPDLQEIDTERWQQLQRVFTAAQVFRVSELPTVEQGLRLSRWEIVLVSFLHGNSFFQSVFTKMKESTRAIF